MPKIKPTRFPNFKAALRPPTGPTLSSFDLFGSQVHLNFASQKTLKTKLGSFLTLLYLATLLYPTYHYTHLHLYPPPTLDCKIFSQQTFASFLERNFGLEFAVPRGIFRIRQITAEIHRIPQIFPATLKIKLNCNCSYENSPIRRSSELTLGTPSPSILDTASKIGGLLPIVTLVFTLVYYLYIENHKINQLIHKGVL